MNNDSNSYITDNKVGDENDMFAFCSCVISVPIAYKEKSSRRMFMIEINRVLGPEDEELLSYFLHNCGSLPRYVYLTFVCIVG